MNKQPSAAQSTSKDAQGQKKFFDLHTRGIGYLNRVRMVTTKGKGGRRGDSFLACAVNALHGDLEDPSTTLFDCRISGKDAQDIVQALMPAVQDNKKVIIGFAIGDIYAQHRAFDCIDVTRGIAQTYGVSIVQLMHQRAVCGCTCYARAAVSPTALFSIISIPSRCIALSPCARTCPCNAPWSMPRLGSLRSTTTATRYRVLAASNFRRNLASTM